LLLLHDAQVAPSATSAAIGSKAETLSARRPVVRVLLPHPRARLRLGLLPLAPFKRPSEAADLVRKLADLVPESVHLAPTSGELGLVGLPLGLERGDDGLLGGKVGLELVHLGAKRSDKVLEVCRTGERVGRSTESAWQTQDGRGTTHPSFARRPHSTSAPTRPRSRPADAGQASGARSPTPRGPPQLARASAGAHPRGLRSGGASWRFRSRARGVEFEASRAQGGGRLAGTGRG
jgi:hypothetical protein